MVRGQLGDSETFGVASLARTFGLALVARPVCHCRNSVFLLGASIVIEYGSEEQCVLVEHVSEFAFQI